MRHFWQWLCGYVCICLKGRQINRFLNICSRNGIHLWRITYDVEQSIRANLKLRDFYQLKPYLRKTKTKLKILSRKGFPFWCYRHPKLKWFLCICICVLMLGVYSMNFVWAIEIKGNTKVSTQKILKCLNENAINIGLKKSDIDCSGIEYLLRESFEQVGWVSVYFESTRLCIEVKESLYDVLEDVETEQGKSYNLVADKDAIIHSIVTRAGQSLVKKGQSVKQGEILILGQNEIFDDSGAVKQTLYFKADAQIIGDVVYEIEIPFTEIELLSLKISKKYDDDMLLRLGYHKLQAYIDKFEANGVIILDTNGMLKKNEKNICFYVTIFAREQIGISIPVEEARENEFE